MTYRIELLCLGTDLYAELEIVLKSLNSAQREFIFDIAPVRFRPGLASETRKEYVTAHVFERLRQYRKEASGSRPYLIAFVNGSLRSARLRNLFGSLAAGDGLAVVSIMGIDAFEVECEDYIRYYLIRYAMSFIAPEISTHRETRGCFFDQKIYKPDLMKSLRSGRICDDHLGQLSGHLNRELESALFAMISVHMASLHLAESVSTFKGPAPDVVDGPDSEPPSVGHDEEPVHTVPIPVVFAWVHVSDIHFGAGGAAWRVQQRQVARALKKDLENYPWQIDRIFVTGDIAYSADRTQYESAHQWLQELESPNLIRLVPGNHDVDRRAAEDFIVQSVHLGARVNPSRIDDALAHEEARRHLSGKLSEYRAFVSRFEGHPGAVNGLDWVEVIDLRSRRGGLIRVAGLSSVWVSDRSDGKHDVVDDVFVPNMLLSNLQIEQTMEDASPSEFIVVLSHHPPEWLHPTSSGLLGRFLARRPHVHLCGHVHRMAARFQRDFGAGRWLRYVAGASHGDPREPPRHAYAWGALRRNEVAGTWEIGWAPRTYVMERNEFRADGTAHDLDSDGFAWEPIELGWDHSPG